MYRVSKDTLLLSFKNKGSKKGARAYDIFVIMLPVTCPSVTTASGNKLLRTFFAL